MSKSLKKEWSEWLYVLVLGSAPICVYSSAYLSVCFLRCAIEASRAYGDHPGSHLSEYKLWRERHHIEYPMQFQREELLGRWSKTILSDLVD